MYHSYTNRIDNHSKAVNVPPGTRPHLLLMSPICQVSRLQNLLPSVACIIIILLDVGQCASGYFGPSVMAISLFHLVQSLQDRLLFVLRVARQLLGHEMSVQFCLCDEEVQLALLSLHLKGIEQKAQY